jgi:hypothetical protein
MGIKILKRFEGLESDSLGKSIVVAWVLWNGGGQIQDYRSAVPFFLNHLCACLIDVTNLHLYLMSASASSTSHS